MKTTFYFVQAEFYSYGKQAAFVGDMCAEAQPRGYRRDVYGMTAFKLWFSSEIAAQALVDVINKGTASADDVAYALTGKRAAA